MKYLKKLENGEDMVVNLDGSDKVLRELGYKSEDEVNKTTMEVKKQMSKTTTKASKIIASWDANLTVKENQTKLEGEGIVTNICYLYTLAGKNQLGFARKKAGRKAGKVADVVEDQDTPEVEEEVETDETGEAEES
jgi:muramoyltetrapeptide carboxypeptidase LdcA involved in peptidoglycan recycling